MENFSDHPDVWDEQHDFVRPSLSWWNGFGSLWRYQKEGGQEEWMGYYKNLYKSQGPSPHLFKILLQRNGLWNIPNSFFDGNPHYYAFCADGVALADVDFVLGRWEEKYAPKDTQDINSSQSSPAPDNRSEKEKKTQALIAEISRDWEVLYRHHPQDLQGQSIVMTEDNNRREWIKTQKKWESDAIACLVLLFSSPLKNWQWMEKVVHVDNIRLLCKIVYDNAPKARKAKLLRQWKKANWVTAVSEKWFK